MLFAGNKRTSNFTHIDDLIADIKDVTGATQVRLRWIQRPWFTLLVGCYCFALLCHSILQLASSIPLWHIELSTLSQTNSSWLTPPLPSLLSHSPHHMMASSHCQDVPKSKHYSKGRSKKPTHPQYAWGEATIRPFQREDAIFGKWSQVNYPAEYYRAQQKRTIHLNSYVVIILAFCGLSIISTFLTITR